MPLCEPQLPLCEAQLPLCEAQLPFSETQKGFCRKVKLRTYLSQNLNLRTSEAHFIKNLWCEAQPQLVTAWPKVAKSRQM